MSVRRRRSSSRIRLPLWAFVALVLLAAALFIGVSIWLFNTVQSIAAAWQGQNPDFSSVTEPAPILPPPAQAIGTAEPGQIQPDISLEAWQKWPGRERVNVLTLGIDQRCDEEGPTRTDSMMVLTVDPVGMTAGALSLPRDLWVEIPDFGVDRVNQAYYLGEAYQVPGGGPALAMETVEALLGISLDYYVTVNFDAFIEVVDLIGGIDVTVSEEIDDQSYPDRCYGYDPFHIEPGQQHLNGATALKYARTRATFGGDIDREARQQQVILAVREKVTQLNMLPRLVTQAPQLWLTFQRNVHTNMTLDEAIQLALLVQDIPPENLHTAVIDYQYVYNETTPDGQQVLVPIRDNIRALRDELFALPAAPTPALENLPTLMAAESARVAVYNGTTVFGLAGATRDYLLGRHVSVTEVGNADSATYSSTYIIDFGSHPYTTLYLAQLLHVPPLNVSSGTEPPGDFDVLVILGSDWEVPES
ncbi:MAG: LCP family protein [Chloroflexota bacterium]